MPCHVKRLCVAFTILHLSQNSPLKKFKVRLNFDFPSCCSSLPALCPNSANPLFCLLTPEKDISLDHTSGFNLIFPNPSLLFIYFLNGSFQVGSTLESRIFVLYFNVLQKFPRGAELFLSFNSVFVHCL